ncbi:MAG: FecCD family ABC transporter permease [Oscillospiraceae bacterium]
MKRFSPHKGYFIHLILALVLVAVMLWSLCVGKYEVRVGDNIKIIFASLLGDTSKWPSMTVNVVMKLRLPRILAAVIVGSCLSVSGATYQGIFRNPLVSPDFLGVSSGACIGAAVAILLAQSAAVIQVFAFLGGCIAVALTTLIPKLMRSSSNIMLVLSGIIVGGLMSSIMGMIKYWADPDTELAAITYWQMGSLSYITYDTLLSIAVSVIVCTVVLLLLGFRIDILSLGETDARTLGADVEKIRGVAIICATLLTASSVCIAGTIGWIGLVIPHFGRMLVGSENKRLLPATCLIGAIFLLVVDTVTRTVGTAELPLSILTGVIGAPFYAWLLYRQRARVG